MTQYMLAVHGAPDEASYATDEEMQAAFKAVDEFNARIIADGTWVFGGGLEPADIATVVDDPGNEVLTTDGPFAETKEHLGGFWIVECKDLDAALSPRRRAARPPAARRSRCVRSSPSPSPSPRRARNRAIRAVRPRADVPHRVRPGGGHPGPAVFVRTSTIAEEAVQEAFVIASRRWPTDGTPPNPGGWIVTTARNRAIDRLRRESSRHVPLRPGGAHP